MPDDANFSLDRNADNDSVVRLAGREIATTADFASAVSLDETAPIDRYCEAVNHLEHGNEFLVIHDPAAYIAKYEAKLASEDPNAPWQEGVIRLRDFGRAELELIQPPRRQGEVVIFFVEDAFLGIPYQVTAPAPGHSGTKVSYEPVSTNPLPPAPSPAKKSGGSVEPTKPLVDSAPPPSPRSR